MKNHPHQLSLGASPPTGPSLSTLAAPRAVKKGEKVRMEVVYDGALRVQPWIDLMRLFEELIAPLSFRLRGNDRMYNPILP